MSLMTRESQSRRSSWHGAAFLVEALILLAFLIASMAIFFQLFSAASMQGKESVRLTEAVTLASSAAEEFAADPTSVPAGQTVNGYQVEWNVTPHATSAGVLYDAHIVVSQDGQELYALDTSRYVSEVS